MRTERACDTLRCFYSFSYAPGEEAWSTGMLAPIWLSEPEHNFLRDDGSKMTEEQSPSCFCFIQCEITASLIWKWCWHLGMVHGLGGTWERHRLSNENTINFESLGTFALVHVYMAMSVLFAQEIIALYRR